MPATPPARSYLGAAVDHSKLSRDPVTCEGTCPLNAGLRVDATERLHVQAARVSARLSLSVEVCSFRARQQMRSQFQKVAQIGVVWHGIDSRGLAVDLEGDLLAYDERIVVGNLLKKLVRAAAMPRGCS